jgi:hypothetical protein
MRKFAQFMSVSDYETLLENMRKQRTLFKRIKELAYYRYHLGMTKFKEIEKYNNEKAVKTASLNSSHRRRTSKQERRKQRLTDTPTKRLTRAQLHQQQQEQKQAQIKLEERKQRRRISSKQNDTISIRSLKRSSNISSSALSKYQSPSKKMATSHVKIECKKEKIDDDDDEIVRRPVKNRSRTNSTNSMQLLNNSMHNGSVNGSNDDKENSDVDVDNDDDYESSASENEEDDEENENSKDVSESDEIDSNLISEDLESDRDEDESDADKEIESEEESNEESEKSSLEEGESSDEATSNESNQNSSESEDEDNEEENEESDEEQSEEDEEMSTTNSRSMSETSDQSLSNQKYRQLKNSRLRSNLSKKSLNEKVSKKGKRNTLKGSATRLTRRSVSATINNKTKPSVNAYKKEKKRSTSSSRSSNSNRLKISLKEEKRPLVAKKSPRKLVNSTNNMSNSNGVGNGTNGSTLSSNDMYSKKKSFNQGINSTIKTKSNKFTKSKKSIKISRKKNQNESLLNGRRTERLCSMPGYNLLSDNEKKVILRKSMKLT